MEKNNNIVTQGVIILIAVILFGALATYVGQVIYSNDIQNQQTGSGTDDFIVQTNHTLDIDELSNEKFLVTSSSATAHNNSWLEFDGVNDCILGTKTINLNLSSGFTNSIWVRMLDSNLSTGTEGVIVNFKNSSNTGSLPTSIIGIRDSSGIAQFRNRLIINSSGCDNGPYTTGFAKDDGEWHNIIYGFNKTDLFTYVDGVLNITQDVSSSCVNELEEKGFLNYNISFGSNLGCSSNAVSMGSQDEFRMYNKTLSITEISEIYNSGRIANSSLPSDNLVLWYSFNEASGDIVYDKSGNGNHGE